MDIRVNDAARNIAALEAALNEAQKRCTARVITAEDIREELKRVERRLGVSLNALEGTRIHADLHAEKHCAAYLKKGTPQSTHFEAICTNGCWHITNIQRTWQWQYDTGTTAIFMSDKTRDAVLARLSRI